MPKTRGRLVYSYRKNNKNLYGGYIITHPQKGDVFIPIHKAAMYTPCLIPIVKALFMHELEEAKKRVSIDRWGKYKYNPSQQYIKAYKRICLKENSLI